MEVVMHCFLRFPGWKDKAMTLSYDDCVCYDERLIRIMQKYGLKGTFNVNAGLMGTTRRMDEKTAVQLYQDADMEVGMHGYKHHYITACSNADVWSEFYQDKLELERIFGVMIRGGAYAYGVYNDHAINVLKSLGVEYFRTTVSTHRFDLPEDWMKLNPTCHHREKIEELFNEFIAEQPDKIYYKNPKLFYLWGHSYEFNDNDNWDVIENFGKKVAERTDIWHATNIEICEYVKAYKELVFSAKGDKVMNRSTLDIYLWIDGKNVLAKTGKVSDIL